MKRFASFDIIAICPRNIDDADKLRAASRADIDDEFIEIFHNKIKPHACAALFLFDLIAAHGKTPREISPNFFRRERPESVVHGNEKVRSVACKRKKTRFV